MGLWLHEANLSSAISVVIDGGGPNETSLVIDTNNPDFIAAAAFGPLVWSNSCRTRMVSPPGNGTMVVSCSERVGRGCA